VGDWPRLVNLRRCARGSNPEFFTANNAKVALYNNSLGPELILVWQFQILAIDAPPAQFHYQQGQPSGTNFLVEPIVPGDAPPPGLLIGYDDPAVIPGSWQEDNTSGQPQWPATFPFAVLQPGWSLVVENVAVDAQGPIIQYFWEAILSKYFDRVHTNAQLEIDIIADGK
jgi:hypothetical protein